MWKDNTISVNRGSLYYNKYEYKAKCYIPAAGYTRNIQTIDQFNEIIDRVRKYINITQINDQVKDSIVKLIDFTNSDRDVRLRIEYGTVLFFFNDLKYTESIENIAPILSLEKVILHPNDELYLRNPFYKYRTYIKPVSTMPYVESLRSLSEYANKTPHIRLSSGIAKGIEYGPNRKISRYFFSGGHVDYNDESTLTILHLYLGPMVKKTVKLCKATKLD